jgi:hypothetical protein
MAEAHLDHPGEVSWFKRYGPLPVLGPCPHAECTHLSTGVIGWGPSMDLYELVACGSVDWDESPSNCAMRCRAWVNHLGQVVSPWLMTAGDGLSREADAPAPSGQ